MSLRLFKSMVYLCHGKKSEQRLENSWEKKVNREFIFAVTFFRKAFFL